MAEAKTESQSRRKRFSDVVSEEDGLSIRVYPLAYAQLDANADTISAVLRGMASVDYAKLREAGMGANAIYWALAPLVGRQLVRLANDCCVPTLESVEAPAGMVVECVIRWIDLSFMTGGVMRRVIAAVEDLLARHVAAADQPTTRTQTPSPPSSDSDSAPKTSTAGAAQTDGRTADGASPSSTPTAVPPAAG